MRKGFGIFFLILGSLLFFGGLYILPLGTDAYLYFWVEDICHGDWYWGAIYANLAAVGAIILGIIMLRSSNHLRGKNTKTRKRR